MGREAAMVMVKCIYGHNFGLETSIGKLLRSLTYLQIVVPHAITVLQDAAPRTFTTLYNTINRQFFNASCFKSYNFDFVRWHLSWWCDPKRWHLPWWCDRTIVFNMYVLEDSDLISFWSGEFLIWPGDTSVHWDYDELLFPLTWAMFIITYLHFEGWQGQSCTRQGGVPKP